MITVNITYRFQLVQPLKRRASTSRFVNSAEQHTASRACKITVSGSHVSKRRRGEKARRSLPTAYKTSYCNSLQRVMMMGSEI